MMLPALELMVTALVVLFTRTEAGSTFPDRTAVPLVSVSSKVTASYFTKRSAAAPLRQLAAPLAGTSGSPESQVVPGVPFQKSEAEGVPVTMSFSVPGTLVSKATFWRPPFGRPPQTRVALFTVEVPPLMRV